MFKKYFQQILQSLGLQDKVSKNELTPEDWERIAQSYKDTFGRDFYQDVDNPPVDNEAIIAGQTKALEILNQATATPGTPPATTIVEAATQAATQMAEMAAQATPDSPVEAVSLKINNINGPGTNATHLYGIPHDVFSLNKRWNKIAVTPSYAITNPVDEETDGLSFRNEVKSFGRSMAARYATLRESGMLDAKRLMSFDNNYSGLTAANLGDQYILRRQDALIARLISFANVFNFFPRRYGIQDRDLMISAFFEKVSQAWQRGEVFKGGMQLQPEVGHVDDAMIKLSFPPMEEIERKYIGYLNREFSDPMKLSMIEFQFMSVMEQAISEQYQRKIMGIYVKPETGVPGHHLTASTGVLYTLIRYIHEHKLKPHNDAAYITYAPGTFLDTVREMLKDIKESVSHDDTVDFDKFTIYLNKNHDLWWKEDCRAQYGRDLDFTGPESMLNRVPDINTPIIWLPNLGQLPLIIVQEPGNIQSLENKPGEMMAVSMMTRFEEILMYSRWKEGTAADFVGIKFPDKDALDANNFHMQRIFMNTPLTLLAADATVLDATKGFWFRTDANAAATTLTDIDKATHGVAYILEIGSETNPTKIVKAGKFDTITADFTPTKVGDYIMLILNSDKTKFLELERTVGGVRTINITLQTNIPGAR